VTEPAGARTIDFVDSRGEAGKITLREEWCKGCGICVTYCPRSVLVVEGFVVAVKEPQNCIKCGMCEAMCPDFVIEVE
jgi:2-oxoglutarate ferredoxin oxidoreductase subunit delta